MTTTLPFITKILPPRLREDVLPRPRLLKRLHQCVDRRVTLVVAGAGCGKTTLLLEFVREGLLPVCWCSLDEQDRDPSLFLEYLLAALDQRFPDCVQATTLRLQSATSIEPVLPSIIGTLVTDLHNNVPEPFVLVLDDVHYIEDAPAVLSALDLLLQRLPEHCRVVLMGRAEPPIRGLPHLKAQREVAGLTSRDLQFTADEVHAFLQHVAGIPASREAAAQLTAWCEGWATGLVFAAEALPFATLAEGPVRHPPPDLFAYLAEEVYGRLSPAVQRFLRRCSVLPALDAEACATVSQDEQAGARLARLSDLGPFLHLLGEGQHYALHGLFRDFLYDRLRSDAEEFAACHRRAGRVLAERRQWSEAITLYHAGGLTDEAVQLLLQTAPNLFQSGRWTTLAQEIDQVPAEILSTWPELLFWRAKVAIPLGQPDLALQLLHRARSLFQAGGRTVELARVSLAEAGANRLRGDLAQAVELSRAALELLRPHEDEHLLLAESYHHLGAALLQRGEYPAAAEALEQARQRYGADGDTYHLAEVHQHLALVWKARGEYGKALAYFEEARAGWVRLGNPGALASILNSLGYLHFALGSHGLALETLTQALAAAQESGSERGLGYTQATLGEVCLAEGRYQEALDHLSRGLDRARAMAEPRLMALIIDDMAAAHLLLGDLPRARVLAEEAAALVGVAQGTHQRGYHEITLGVIANGARDYPAAQAHLSAACRDLAPSGDRVLLARAHFHLAHSLFALGKYEPGLDALHNVKEALQYPALAPALALDARIAPQVPAVAVEHEAGTAWQEAWRTLRQLAAGAGQEAPPASPPAGVPTLQAWALGQCSVALSPVPREASWPTQKAEELCYLLLVHNGWVSKEEIITALWPDSDPARASTMFWTTMYRVRRALLPDAIIRRGQHYRVNPAWTVWFDAHEFERLARPGRRPGLDGDRSQGLDEAVRLYGGPFFPHCYSDWCETTRHRLETYFLQAILRLAQHYGRLGDHARVVELCERGVAVDPFQEDFQYLLVQSLLASGDTIGARLSYRRYAEQLQADLAEEPSPRLRRLVQAIVQG